MKNKEIQYTIMTSGGLFYAESFDKIYPTTSLVKAKKFSTVEAAKSFRNIAYAHGNIVTVIVSYKLKTSPVVETAE